VPPYRDVGGSRTFTPGPGVGSVPAGESGVVPAHHRQRLDLDDRVFGGEPPEHLLDRRLDCAIAMLRDPDSTHLKIGEIAARAGFADISHFNRSFRRIASESPSEFRMRMKSPQNHLVAA